MGKQDLFQIENDVITAAQQVLQRRSAGETPSAQDYQWLLEQYVRLSRQNRRLVWFGDRMQAAVNREMTALKKSEAEKDALTEDLSKTSKLLNTVLDAIPDVIGVQDMKHGILRYNKAGYDFIGKPPGEVHGQKSFRLIGRDQPCNICTTDEVYRSGQPTRIERYIAETDTWFDVRAYPILDNDGQVCQVVEHLRDISIEKKAHIRLREAHERLVTILDSIDAHIYVADVASFKVLFMNKKMVDDFEADYTGCKCYEAFNHIAEPCAHCPNKALLDPRQNPKGGSAFQSESPVTGRWYLNFDRNIRWVDGQKVKIRIATDITESRRYEAERREMQAQVQQAQKFEAIGTLAAGVAHDFNNLLMGIQGQASILDLALGPDHAYGERTRAVFDYVESAKDLTQQLLGLARGGKYEALPTDINRVVGKSATLFGRTRKDILIHKHLPETPSVVTADRRQLEQVMLNLLLNAWQAMPEGGEIHIRIETVRPDEVFCRHHGLAAAPHVRIAVEDNGTGMDKATCQRIFDPFFTTKAKERGTGLGLASAYGIIKNHAGTITVDSEMGRGTRFCIYLPLSEKRATPDRCKDEAILKGAETLLLIDDEQMVREVGQEMLESIGYRVLVADGGESGVEMVRQNNGDIDLVILDMVMPGLGGARTFDRIQAIRPGIPVLLASGYSREGQANRIMERGCRGFIQKPFSISELSKMIRSIIEPCGEPADGEKEIDQPVRTFG